MARYSHVAWDFNGTVLDDVSIGITAVNRLLERRSLRIIESEEAYRGLFDFPVIDYYKRLGFDFDKYPYDELAIEWVNEYNSLSHLARAREGIEEALARLKDAGVKQYIVSASSIDMLKAQLDSLGLTGYFEKIIGSDNIHAYGKKEATKIFADSLDKERTVFIGDTVHDYDSAAYAGIDCIFISGGHQSKEKLLTRSDVIFDSFKEITDIILR